MTCADDEDAAVDGDRWHGRPARVEDDQVGLLLGGKARPVEHVRDEHPTGETAAGSPAADGAQTRQRRELEMVGGSVAPGAGELDEVGDRRRLLDELGLARAAPPHRHDDDVAIARGKRGDVPGDGGLADALAGADHADRGDGDLLEPRRVEAEVGADVRQPRRERPRRPPEALAGSEHGLVREVDDELGVAEVVDERHAVFGPPAQLLGPADEDRTGPVVRQLSERVAHDFWHVLPVDQRDRSHWRVVTSRSILPVYFSYSSVSRSNWMIRSRPWNG